MFWVGAQSRGNDPLWGVRPSRLNCGKGHPTTEAAEQSAAILALFLCLCGRIWQAVNFSEGYLFSQDATKHRA